jgi:antitoxin (DNA-binding transcriptional repressor) of toxin-antitoxin stability system
MSATKARNKFFDILTWVSMGKTVMIEKDNKLIANISPISKIKRNKGLLKALDSASVGFVYTKNDNPLRKKGSADFLGRWDK